MKYGESLNKAYRHAEKVRQRQKLNEIKHSNDKKKEPLSFSKIAVLFIFINCLIIELYSMVVMVIFHDLNSLGSLIMGVIGQCVSLLGYFVKAGQENLEGGITYETVMYELKGKSEPIIEEEKKEEDDGSVG
jgi:uncharacterized ion transporter superfamily protein YfcC